MALFSLILYVNSNIQILSSALGSSIINIHYRDLELTLFAKTAKKRW